MNVTRANFHYSNVHYSSRDGERRWRPLEESTALDPTPPIPAQLSRREIIARAIYRVRPFRKAETSGVMDGCLTEARELSWDGAPPFYQRECYEIADAIVYDLVLAEQGEVRDV